MAEVTTKLAGKTYIDAVNALSSFINTELIDPLSDSGNSRGSGTGLAVTDDDTKVTNYPKITFYPITVDEGTVLTNGKTEYRERNRFEIAILYTCLQKHTWTYNSVAYKGKMQCIQYLTYLKDKIKANRSNATYFTDFNEIIVGSISNPEPNQDTHTYEGFLIVKLDSFSRNRLT